MLEVNQKDYAPEDFQRYFDSFTLQRVLEIIRTCHYYEVYCGGELVACGGLNRDLSQERQCYFTAIFVRPDLRGRGVGKALIRFLEQGEWALDSRLIEVPSSKSSHGFYHKCGYQYRTQPPVFSPEDGSMILYKERSLT